jgi:hypothetical protein
MNYVPGKSRRSNEGYDNMHINQSPWNSQTLPKSQAIAQLVMSIILPPAKLPAILLQFPVALDLWLWRC